MLFMHLPISYGPRSNKAPFRTFMLSVFGMYRESMLAMLIYFWMAIASIRSLCYLAFAGNVLIVISSATRTCVVQPQHEMPVVFLLSKFNCLESAVALLSCRVIMNALWISILSFWLGWRTWMAAIFWKSGKRSKRKLLKRYLQIS